MTTKVVKLFKMDMTSRIAVSDGVFESTHTTTVSLRTGLANSNFSGDGG